MEKTILIIDDDIDFQFMVGNMLQTCGYQVRTLLEGKLKVAVDVASKCDMVLLDITLPHITITSRNLALVEVIKYPELDKRFEYFEILIGDEGIGFDQKFEEKIFQIFQRLHSKEDYPGTGIGLALCKKIVLNHDGLIFAEAHEGAGSLFHIILPLNRNHLAVELLPGYSE